MSWPWVVVWMTEEGPSVGGPYATGAEAYEAARAEWAAWKGGRVGGYRTGSLIEFLDVYERSEDIWVVPCTPATTRPWPNLEDVL